MAKNDANLNDNKLDNNNTSLQFSELTEITDRLIELISKDIIDYTSKSYYIFNI